MRGGARVAVASETAQLNRRVQTNAQRVKAGEDTGRWRAVRSEVYARTRRPRFDGGCVLLIILRSLSPRRAGPSLGPRIPPSIARTTLSYTPHPPATPPAGPPQTRPQSQAFILQYSDHTPTSPIPTSSDSVSPTHCSKLHRLPTSLRLVLRERLQVLLRRHKALREHPLQPPDLVDALGRLDRGPDALLLVLGQEPAGLAGRGGGLDGRLLAGLERARAGRQGGGGGTGREGESEGCWLAGWEEEEGFGGGAVLRGRRRVSCCGGGGEGRPGWRRGCVRGASMYSPYP